MMVDRNLAPAAVGAELGEKAPSKLLAPAKARDDEAEGDGDERMGNSSAVAE